MLQQQTVSPECFQLIKDLMELEVLNNFRLVGGTALALQYGHRLSVDVDLFSEKEFDSGKILSSLQAALYPGRVENIRSYPFGFFCDIRTIKTDFMFWGDAFVEPPIILNGIRFASSREIFAMKLHAIGTRRTKKDFIDIAILLDTILLKDALLLFQEKYPGYERSAVIKQLNSFEQADHTPMPEMLTPFTWEQVKEKINKAVKDYWQWSTGTNQ